MLVYVRGNPAKLNSSQSFDARGWGYGRLRRKIAAESGLFEDMEAYYRQLKFLTWFYERIHNPKERGTYFLNEEPEAFRKQLRSHLENLLRLPEQRTSITSLKGLDAYDIADRAIFAGRGEIVDEIFEAIDRRDAREDLATAGIIVGASGAGKSSLLRAGVAAEALEGARNTGKRVFRVLVVTPRQLGAANPAATLAAMLAAESVLPEIGRAEDFSALVSEAGAGAPEIVISRIEQACRAAAIKESERRRFGSRPSVRLILGVDQLDEIVDAAVEDRLPEALHQFLELILHGARRRAFWLIGTLADTRLSRWNRLIAQDVQIFDHWPLANPREGLNEIIDLSFRALTLGLAYPLQKRLIASCQEIDQGRTATLPLLSVAMTRLAEAAKQTGRDSVLGENLVSDLVPVPASVEFMELADIRSAIHELAERAWQEAYPSTQTTETTQSLDVGRLFRKLVAVNLKEDQDSITLLECDPGDPSLVDFHSLIRALRARRLLVDTEELRVRLVHECAVRHWRRASQWFQDARETLGILETIRIFAAHWAAAEPETKSSMLLPLGYCRQAQRVLAIWSGDYARVPTDFIRESLAQNASHFVHQPNKAGLFPLAMAAHLGELRLVKTYLSVGAPVDVRAADQATPLHIAARNGFASVVAELLGAGADPNARMAAGFTPLMTAAETGSVEIMRQLVDVGAQVDVVNDAGWTPLHVAVANHRIDAARLLLDRGASIERLTAEERQSALHLACEAGDAPMVEFLLTRGADPNRHDANETALLAATRQHHTASVKLLLRHGAQPNQGRTDDRQTPLIIAVEDNDPEMVAVLLEHGADPDLCSEHLPYSPLRSAIRRERPGIVSQLVTAGASVNSVCPDGQTALHEAACSLEGDSQVRALLDAGGDLNLASSDGRSALESAVMRGCEATVALLLEHGAAVNHRSRNGFTPLHWAAHFGNAAACSHLLAAGAQTGVEDAAGWTPLFLALAGGERDAARILLDAGVPPAAASSTGMTALAAAAGAGDASMVQDLLERITRESCEPDASLALARAAQNGRTAVIRLLLGCRGARVDATDGHGLSPLIYASWRSHPEAVDTLLAHGADPNGANPTGWTPLYFAIVGPRADRRNERIAETIERLLTAGASLDCRDRYGRTPIDVARLCGSADLVSMLEGRTAGMAIPTARSSQGSPL